MPPGALSDAVPHGRTPFSNPAQPAFEAMAVAASARRRIGWRAGYPMALMVTDAVVVIAALVTAQAVRWGLSPLEARQVSVEYSLLTIGVAALWMAALAGVRSREVRHLGHGTAEFSRVANATLITFGVIAVAAVLFKLPIARSYLLAALPLGLAGLLLGRIVWRNWLAARRREGACLTGSFVVGTHQDAIRIADQLLQHRHAGYKPVGIACTDGVGLARTAEVGGASIPLIPYSALPEMTRATRTRAVIVAGELPGGREEVQDLGWRLENSRTEMILVSRLTDVAGPRIHMRPVDGLPMLHVDLPQYEGLNHSVKRGIDLALAAVATLLLSPVLIAVALAVRLDSRGPVLFRQERIGAHGQRFTMFKFRSMVVDAERRLAALQTDNQGSGLLFKMQNDPRITRVGRFIRRYSLDELPQLLNVLNGTMSLIGPRPPLPREVAAYEGRVNRRLLIKPGITGLWQVSGRSNLSWEESVKLDLYYVENWSVTTDFIILLKTVRAVVGKEGAY